MSTDCRKHTRRDRDRIAEVFFKLTQAVLGYTSPSSYSELPRWEKDGYRMWADRVLAVLEEEE